MNKSAYIASIAKSAFLKKMAEDGGPVGGALAEISSVRSTAEDADIDERNAIISGEGGADGNTPLVTFFPTYTPSASPTVISPNIRGAQPQCWAYDEDQTQPMLGLDNGY